MYMWNNTYDITLIIRNCQNKNEKIEVVHNVSLSDAHNAFKHVAGTECKHGITSQHFDMAFIRFDLF